MEVTIIILSTIVAAMALENPYCELPCDLYNEKLTNTVCLRKSMKCGFGPKCGNNTKVLKLNDTMRKYILDMHNDFRNHVAIGEEPRGPQPSASNMNILSYDKELEFMVQCWTNECLGNPLVHDKCRRSKKYEYVGQNLATYGHTMPNYFEKVDILPIIFHMTAGWYNEVRDYKKDKEYSFDIKYGHYTQMVWANTTHVGCAGTFYKEGKWNRFLFGCNYGPSGNFIGLSMYDEGEPCSKCTGGCNGEFKGLCGDVKRVEDFKPFYHVV